VRLAGETALVTGSTSGIGRAIAIAFAGEGAAVVVTGRDATRGAHVVEEITDAGGTAHFVAADLHDEAACRLLVEQTLDVLGDLSVLVNNAAGGDAVDASIADMTTASWDAILRVDLTAPMWCIRDALPHMRRHGHGSIINISSRAGERASAGNAAYAAAKGGLNALTRSVAVEEAKFGIRCNTISPGYVLNERRDAGMGQDRRARFEAMHLTRLGLATDVAHAAVYLASSEAGFVTGINLQLDGGSSIARAATLG
jgi:meso-butanediol dehydrogenase / (S,S)-butanediol dehydrogenase / diacetyl reductase